jgi:hypothetical protein
MQTGTLSANPSDSVVRKAVQADPDYDSNMEMSMSGGGGDSFNRNRDAIFNATTTYGQNNNGQIPTDPSPIATDLNRSVDSVTLQKYFGEATADITANPPPSEAITMAPVITAYTAAPNGQGPNNPADLPPCISTPQQQGALQTILQKLAPNAPAPK